MFTPNQHQVIMHLKQNPEGVTIQQTAEAMGRNDAAGYAMVGNIIKRGLETKLFKTIKEDRPQEFALADDYQDVEWEGLNCA